MKKHEIGVGDSTKNPLQKYLFQMIMDKDSDHNYNKIFNYPEEKHSLIQRAHKSPYGHYCFGGKYVTVPEAYDRTRYTACIIDEFISLNVTIRKMTRLDALCLSIFFGADNHGSLFMMGVFEMFLQKYQHGMELVKKISFTLVVEVCVDLLHYQVKMTPG